MNIEELYRKFEQIEQVEALALGGSRASGNADEKSDYDIYVYVTENLENEVRNDILCDFCSEMEIGNEYWENEDNVVLNNGVCADIIYRKLDDFQHIHEYIVEKCYARNGYTTCFWHNIKTCQIIFDKTGRFTELQKKCNAPYPQELKKNIIKRNMNLLSGCLPSYDKQIKKAYDRHDFVSINHRVAGFLESYFDVIFALNEITHPGEKNLVKICKAQCSILPEKFEENLVVLFNYMFQYDVSDILQDMVDKLKKLTDL